MAIKMFVLGSEYKRSSEIHALYGGQAQSGISTPRLHPVIFIFTSDSGHAHGYYDRWVDGIFHYTGEGQIGDMEFKSGNKAIRDHIINNKTIHLFEESKRSHVRYIGTASYLGHHYETRPDRQGDTRQAIIFHLDIDSAVQSASESVYIADNDYMIESLRDRNLLALRKAAIEKAKPSCNFIQKSAIAKYRSEAIKLYVSARSNGVCEGCQTKAPFSTKKGPYLECHHIFRLADGGPDHPENVIALCPNCHRRAHYSSDMSEFNTELADVAKLLENP